MSAARTCQTDDRRRRLSQRARLYAARDICARMASSLRMAFKHESIYRLQKGRKIDRFWRAEILDKVLTIAEGDMWSPDTAERRRVVHRSPDDAYDVLIDEELDRANRGYCQIFADEFDAAVRSWKGKKHPAQPRTAPPDEETRAPIPLPSGRRRPPKKQRLPKRSGPFARSRTGPVIHRLVFSPAGEVSREKAPRVTSGGRPIMAEGQPWPVCPYCARRLGLYLQFDIEDQFDLTFPAGSHVLVFHCPTCRAVPLGFWRKGNEWLKPDYRALYRIIVNPPGAREFLHEIDPRIVEQRVTFAKRKERVRKNLDGPVGVEEVKIGGLPHWVQPPDYPRCACGAAMGFLLQVPAMKNADWKQKQSDGMPWGGGLDTFVFACTRPCSPYAAVMVTQR